MNRFLKVLLCLTAVMLLAAALWSPAVADSGVKALFINVGKADAALIFAGEQRFLVDTGTKGSYDALERALSLYGVTRLDGVIVTHTDKDHVGGLKKLLKSDIQVDRVYSNRLNSEPADDDHPAYAAALEQQIPFTWLAAGDSVAAGESVFKVLGPLQRDALNENNNSLVMDFQTPEGNMLLTGDMELEEEAALLDGGLIPQAAVLKVAHHGEDDATSKRLVLAAKPQWAVISTSTAEEPDTPDNKVVARLWEVKAGVAVTQNAEIGIMVTLQGGTATAEQIDLP